MTRNSRSESRLTAPAVSRPFPTFPTAMNCQLDFDKTLTRRTFLARSTTGLGALALTSLLNPRLFAASEGAGAKSQGALPTLHYPARAKRVIYLFQSGAPSHLDLFDWKPKLAEKRGIALPESIRMGQRLTGMTSGQSSKPVAPAIFKFAQHGKSGATLSELLPH